LTDRKIFFQNFDIFRQVDFHGTVFEEVLMEYGGIPSYCDTPNYVDILKEKDSNYVPMGIKGTF
jgi:hypothetical protein